MRQMTEKKTGPPNMAEVEILEPANLSFEEENYDVMKVANLDISPKDTAKK